VHEYSHVKGGHTKSGQGILCSFTTLYSVDVEMTTSDIFHKTVYHFSCLSSNTFQPTCYVCIVPLGKKRHHPAAHPQGWLKHHTLDPRRHLLRLPPVFTRMSHQSQRSHSWWQQGEKGRCIRKYSKTAHQDGALMTKQYSKTHLPLRVQAVTGFDERLRLKNNLLRHYFPKTLFACTGHHEHNLRNALHWYTACI